MQGQSREKREEAQIMIWGEMVMVLVVGTGITVMEVIRSGYILSLLYF